MTMTDEPPVQQALVSTKKLAVSAPPAPPVVAGCSLQGVGQQALWESDQEQSSCADANAEGSGGSSPAAAAAGELLHLVCPSGAKGWTAVGLSHLQAQQQAQAAGGAPDCSRWRLASVMGSAPTGAPVKLGTKMCLQKGA